MFPAQSYTHPFNRLPMLLLLHTDSLIRQRLPNFDRYFIG